MRTDPPSSRQKHKSKRHGWLSLSVPISVPSPMVLPRRAIKAPSPPEDPPEESSRLWGLSVWPRILFMVSPICYCCVRPLKDLFVDFL